MKWKRIWMAVSCKFFNGNKCCCRRKRYNKHDDDRLLLGLGVGNESLSWFEWNVNEAENTTNFVYVGTE